MNCLTPVVTPHGQAFDALRCLSVSAVMLGTQSATSIGSPLSRGGLMWRAADGSP
ncbi:MAG TPA: hypothetical protein VGM10_14180 [Actinocrinis sp.]